MLLVAAGRLLTSVALADAGGLASQGGQEIKFGAADAPVFDDVDVINDRRVEREDALDAYAERGLAHGDRLADAFASTRDYNPLERLQPLLGLALLDPDVNADGVAGNEIRDVAFQLRFFNVIKFVHCSFTSIIEYSQISSGSGPNSCGFIANCSARRISFHP